MADSRLLDLATASAPADGRRGGGDHDQMDGMTPLQAFKNGLKLRPKTASPKSKEETKRKAA